MLFLVMTKIDNFFFFLRILKIMYLIFNYYYNYLNEWIYYNFEHFFNKKIRDFVFSLKINLWFNAIFIINKMIIRNKLDTIY